MDEFDEKWLELERRVRDLEQQPKQYAPIIIEHAKPYDPYQIDFYSRMEQ